MPKSPLSLLSLSFYLSIIGSHTAAFEFSWALRSCVKTKKTVAPCLCFLCCLAIARMTILSSAGASSYPHCSISTVQPHKRVLWKGTDSVPIPGYFSSSSIMSTCVATHLLFLHYPLASSFPSLGQPVYFNPSARGMSSCMHRVSPCSSIVPSFVGIIDPLLCKSRWMNGFIALKKTHKKKPFLFSLLLHRCLVNLWFFLY